MEEFPYRKKIEIDKPDRPRLPKETAVIEQIGCTGCEACISFCPVDCIEIVPGPVHPEMHKLVEVDLERCIGCQLCARYCPWETIEMWSWEEGVAVAPELTVRSLIYDYDAVGADESAEMRVGPAGV
ncbi:MAG: 4Fe-4S binding protein [Acidobacteria bacterium]|nr:4Fe-4S binding protein [Acidobacteriota bacterium]